MRPVGGSTGKRKWLGLKITGLVLMTLALASGLAGGPVLAQVPQQIRIGIITSNPGSQYCNARTVTFLVRGSYQVVDLAAIPGADVIGTPGEGESWQVYYLPGGIQVCRNLEPPRTTTGPVVIRETSHDSGSRVGLEDYTNGGSRNEIGKWYRGNMEFRSNTNGVTAINELPLEEYLSGVVPREMSNSWHLEALKAQAIAARTYAAANYNKRLSEGFNLLDTQYDQVYGGVNSEGANATRAVQETSGQIILCNGQPISAAYHSCSGGHTEDNENVWTTTGPCPYLRGKDDPYSTTNGLATWTYTVSLEEIKNRLNQSGSPAGSPAGPVISIQLEKYDSGRVSSVMITDLNGNTITTSGSEFGKLFNPKFYTYINKTSFMSNFFDVKTDQLSTPSFAVLNGRGESRTIPATALYAATDDGGVSLLNEPDPDFSILSADGVTSSPKAPAGNVVFEGHGWGHGVGMSQWGAYEMARQGKSCRDILTFYYTGVEIR